jgi:hypothetical protein
MTTLEVPGIGVEVGDRLDDGQLVVGIVHNVKTDECWKVRFSLAETLSGQHTGTRTVDSTDMLTVERPG